MSDGGGSERPAPSLCGGCSAPPNAAPPAPAVLRAVVVAQETTVVVAVVDKTDMRMVETSYGKRAMAELTVCDDTMVAASAARQSGAHGQAHAQENVKVTLWTEPKTRWLSAVKVALAAGVSHCASWG